MLSDAPVNAHFRAHTAAAALRNDQIMDKKVVNSKQLSRLVIDGYKSIAHCDLQLNMLNVLIGANGAGKSNFIGFFKLIGRILEQQLQITVGEVGGPDQLLHFGRKSTGELSAELYFGNNGYKVKLKPTQDNRMMFAREALWWNDSGDWRPQGGHFESYADDQKLLTRIYQFVVPAMRSWRLFHFHDTSASAVVKQIHSINDNEYLRSDGRNLAAFLYRLKLHHPEHYERIVKSIQLVAPFFGGFHLRPQLQNPETIQLEWTELGQDIPFGSSALSDGTLRFICLATVLLQPTSLMPAAILIDEPELGLHPYAIVVLADMVKGASASQQVILSTQSVELVDQFATEDLIIVDKFNGASTFKRLDFAALAGWLDDYSLGELWKKNVLGGRPSK